MPEITFRQCLPVPTTAPTTDDPAIPLAPSTQQQADAHGFERAYPQPDGATPPPVPAHEPAPFAFQPRRGRLDWRKLAKLDTERVRAEIDIDALEAHLENLTWADLTEDDLHWFTDMDQGHLFRIMQMIVEYLLYVQEHLHRRNVVLEAAVAAGQERQANLTAQLVQGAEYIGLLEAQLQAAPPPPGAPAAKCPSCAKLFSSPAFLAAHMSRRHPEMAGAWVAQHSDPAKAYAAGGVGLGRVGAVSYTHLTLPTILLV